jgi:hypothetical protein
MVIHPDHESLTQEEVPVYFANGNDERRGDYKERSRGEG